MRAGRAESRTAPFLPVRLESHAPSSAPPTYTTESMYQNIKIDSYKKDDEPLLNLTGAMSRCSREKVLMCTQKRELESPL
jgi:hypothetical protein